MKQIWKFAIPTADKLSFKMPVGAEVLSVAVQHNKPCLWALVNPDAAMETRTFYITGTGHDIPDSVSRQFGLFHGTFLLEDGALVFHIFEVVE